MSGTWANSVYFHDSDHAAPTTPPQGFQGILTRREWAGVIDFSKAVNAKLVTSFSISQGVRDSAGVWTPDQARNNSAADRVRWWRNRSGGFFNEPSFAAMGGAPPGYDAASYARDFSVFQAFARATAPDMLIVGPGSVGEGIKLMPGLRSNSGRICCYPEARIRRLLLTIPMRPLPSAAHLSAVG